MMTASLSPLNGPQATAALWALSVEPGADAGRDHSFSRSIEEKFASPGEGPLHGVSSDPDGRPDVSTLRWLLHSVDANFVADAMKSDAPPRRQASDDYTEDTRWSFAADAAIEALLLPAIRRADGWQSSHRGESFVAATKTDPVAADLSRPCLIEALPLAEIPTKFVKRLTHRASPLEDWRPGMSWGGRMLGRYVVWRSGHVLIDPPGGPIAQG